MSYKRLGDYIQPVNIRNKELEVTTLLGVSIRKVLMPSIANTIGTNMKTYKIIKQNQFAYGPVTSRNGDKISIALLEEHEIAIVSQAYTVFEVIDEQEVLPEYLMMWFRRPEFDRFTRFKSHGSAREVFDWEELCDTQLPIPSIEKQRQIVAEYNTVTNRINLNNQLNQKLEETAQALYKHWFVDFEFPNQDGKPYKSNGGKMVYNEDLDMDIPVGWSFSPISNYIKINSGYAFKSKWWTNKGLPVIKIGTIQNNSVSKEELEYISELNEFNRDNCQVKKGDIVIAMTGFTMGKIGLIPDYLPSFFVNQRVGFFRLDNMEQNNSGFLYCTMKTQEFNNEIWSFGGDSQQFNVSNSQIDSIKIIQPINEELIKNFNSKTTSLFEKIIKSHSLDLVLLKIKSLLLSKMTQQILKAQAV
tara:strand:- start:246 stop:1493 length:1248 start_codon:yes stop_codon:yes gene_type:complete